jgi:flagellar biosynthesis protein FlhF
MSALASGDAASISSVAPRTEAVLATAAGDETAAHAPPAPPQPAPAVEAVEPVPAPQLARRKRTRKTTAKPEIPTPARATDAAAWADALTHKLLAEIHSLRGAFEQRVAGFVPGEVKHDSARATARAHLEAAGFSPGFAQAFVETAPTHVSVDEAADWARHALARKLQSPREEEIVARGGIYALIGPTGVGKTTTTAKIAARCVMRHGADQVALLTTDSYRVGAQEQLRVYARILGVPVHVVRDAPELGATLAKLGDRRVVLIDTMGMSQRDRRVPEQLAILGNAGADVKRLLLLNATCARETLHDVVRAYGDEALRDCIVTKTDEAVTIGAALEAALGARLRIHYLTNGQRVPEDLCPAKRAALMQHAFAHIAGRAPAAGTFPLEAQAAA